MAPGRVLLIDNVDSFTFNVADLLHRVLGGPPTVWGHDHEAGPDDLLGFDAIVVGPGPGRPQHAADLGISHAALNQRQVPVLGVCLGHQGMAHLAGDAVVELAEPMHGRVSQVVHDGSGLFAGVPSPFQAVRYHSLEVRLRGRSPLRPLAWALDDGCVMALSDTSSHTVSDIPSSTHGAGRWGVQFHPDSVLTEHGELIVSNFLQMAGVLTAQRPLPVGHAAVAVGDVHVRRTAEVADQRPVSVEGCSIAARVDTWRLHARLTGAAETAWWLDSSAGSRDGSHAVPAARFSMFGDATGPLSHRLTHRVGEGSTIHGQGLQEHLPGRLLDNLADLLARWRIIDGLDGLDLPTAFRPGYVGYLGYELKAETTGRQAHRSPYPDASLVFADRAVVVDHHTDRVHAIYLCDKEVRETQEAWARRVVDLVRSEAGRVDTYPQRPQGRGEELVVAGLRHTEGDYLRLVERCREQIQAGESYELCLTNMVTWPGVVDEAHVYRLLRQASPVPFGAWLRGQGLCVVGASPERFVAVGADGTVEARPIKGTRPRDADKARDAQLARGLAEAVKDRAENLMIVDLLRNDLHRVCRSGSVHVPDLFAVESYANVHQLVSTVRGELAPGMGPVDVIASCFPGGSMTGAPKVRTMEILDGLEAGPRGVYSGALGWIGLNGAMDLSIVIRTATTVAGQAEFGIGGAVTALSDPAEEFAETLHKSRALARALVAAGEVEFTEGDVLWLLDLAAANDVDLVLDGGWAVDAHLGRQTRRHGDVDIALEWADAGRLASALETEGFVPLPRGDTTAWNFVLADASGRAVDFHVYRLAESGDGLYGEPGREHDVYPATELAGWGTVAGRPVRAIHSGDHSQK